MNQPPPSGPRNQRAQPLVIAYLVGAITASLFARITWIQYIAYVVSLFGWPFVAAVLTAAVICIVTLFAARRRRASGIVAASLFISVVLHMLTVSAFRYVVIARPPEQTPDIDRRPALSADLPSLTESLVSQEVRSELTALTPPEPRPLTPDRKPRTEPAEKRAPRPQPALKPKVLPEPASQQTRPVFAAQSRVIAADTLASLPTPAPDIDTARLASPKPVAVPGNAPTPPPPSPRMPTPAPLPRMPLTDTPSDSSLMKNGVVAHERLAQSTVLPQGRANRSGEPQLLQQAARPGTRDELRPAAIPVASDALNLPAAAIGPLNERRLTEPSSTVTPELTVGHRDASDTVADSKEAAASRQPVTGIAKTDSVRFTEATPARAERTVAAADGLAGANNAPSRIAPGRIDLDVGTVTAAGHPETSEPRADVRGYTEERAAGRGARETVRTERGDGLPNATVEITGEPRPHLDLETAPADTRTFVAAGNLASGPARAGRPDVAEQLTSATDHSMTATPVADIGRSVAAARGAGQEPARAEAGPSPGDHWEPTLSKAGVADGDSLGTTASTDASSRGPRADARGYADTWAMASATPANASGQPRFVVSDLGTLASTAQANPGETLAIAPSAPFDAGRGTGAGRDGMGIEVGTAAVIGRPEAAGPRADAHGYTEGKSVQRPTFIPDKHQGMFVQAGGDGAGFVGATPGAETFGLSPSASRSPTRLDWTVAGGTGGPTTVPAVDSTVGHAERVLISAELSAVPASVPEKAIYALRSPERHKARIGELGGSPETEHAVEQALVWLAGAQSDDGHWDVCAFKTLSQCGGPGDRKDGNVGLTGLCLLSYLGAGYTHVRGDHRETVRKALNWLVTGQTATGDLQRDGQMYGQAMATAALCEGYSMTGDPRLREPVERAVEFILKAQNPGAGWRYLPRQDNDTSVTGWQVLALKSAMIAGIRFPPEHFAWVEAWLDKVRRGQEGGLYTYMPGHGATPTMTAEGWFCQLLMREQSRTRGQAETIPFLMAHQPVWSPKEHTINLYYWYYATLALHLSGAPEFKAWNEALTKALLAGQVKSGPAAGSWEPVCVLSPRGGRVYTTAAAALCLEVYYRYLPFYKQK